MDGVPVRRYLTAFQWNEAKHPARRPLRETVDKLAEGVAQLEDELKLKVADYNTSKSALGQLTRKAGGSLATRDLGDIVAAAPPGCLVESEQLTTLLVAVPAHAAKEWRGCYEKLAQYVVPRSSRTLKEEADYCLVSVTLFRRTVDAFKTAARDRYAFALFFVPITCADRLCRSFVPIADAPRLRAALSRCATFRTTPPARLPRRRRRPA